MTPIIRICSHPGCGHHATHPPHCHTHAVIEQRRRAYKTKLAGYATAHWQQLRLQALARDHWTCQHCNDYADTVHLAPELNDNHTIAMLDDCVSLCRRCHAILDSPRSHHRMSETR